MGDKPVEGEAAPAKEYTLEEVAKHTNAESAWLIIGNSKTGGPKVYDVTKYLDDHPGGAEVMLDVAGGDADAFFEDIGHSKEAREELKKYEVGNFKIDEATLKKMKEEEAKKAKTSGGGAMMGILGVIFVAILAIVFAYLQMQQKAAELGVPEPPVTKGRGRR